MTDDKHHILDLASHIAAQNREAMGRALQLVDTAEDGMLLLMTALVQTASGVAGGINALYGEEMKPPEEMHDATIDVLQSAIRMVRMTKKVAREKKRRKS